MRFVSGRPPGRALVCGLLLAAASGATVANAAVGAPQLLTPKGHASAGTAVATSGSGAALVLFGDDRLGSGAFGGRVRVAVRRTANGRFVVRPAAISKAYAAAPVLDLAPNAAIVAGWLRLFDVGHRTLDVSRGGLRAIAAPQALVGSGRSADTASVSAWPAPAAAWRDGTKHFARLAVHGSHWSTLSLPIARTDSAEGRVPRAVGTPGATWLVAVALRGGHQALVAARRTRGRTEVRTLAAGRPDAFAATRGTRYPVVAWAGRSGRAITVRVADGTGRRTILRRILLAGHPTTVTAMTAASRDGAIVVGWVEQPRGGPGRAVAAVGRAGGRFGPAIVLSLAGSVAAPPLRSAIAADGRAFVAWAGDDGLTGTLALATARAATRFRNVNPVIARRVVVGPAAAPSLAAWGAGRATIAWSRVWGTYSGRPVAVVASFRPDAATNLVRAAAVTRRRFGGGRAEDAVVVAAGMNSAAMDAPPVALRAWSRLVLELGRPATVHVSLRLVGCFRGDRIASPGPAFCRRPRTLATTRIAGHGTVRLSIRALAHGRLRVGGRYVVVATAHAGRAAQGVRFELLADGPPGSVGALLR